MTAEEYYYDVEFLSYLSDKSPIVNGYYWVMMIKQGYLILIYVFVIFCLIMVRFEELKREHTHKSGLYPKIHPVRICIWTHSTVRLCASQNLTFCRISLLLGRL